jgi:hypothetical protein
MVLTVVMVLTVLPMELCAQAGDPRAGQAGADLEAEWVRQGNNFTCRTKPTPATKLSRDEILAQITHACLRMGPLAVGDEAKLIEPMLGKPARTLARPNDTTALVFFLGQSGNLPYHVVTVQQDRIVALQISGSEGAERFSFNQIGLGTTSGALLERFGRPLQSGPSGSKDTELWSYNPWTFSFEVTGGRVTSIRIAAKGF